ncbi:hypothetical protein T492DRAFT_878017 [Pavlovales sp. CCMP2436]|nr:hypothetical protein T492DRAFT_878017 [Pavlovales sp. CCMP2436]
MKVLTVRCPKCAHCLCDFDGCFALACSECAAHLCGWCLAECADGAHAHVLKCGAKPEGHVDCLGSRAHFDAAQRRRQAAQLGELVEALPEDAPAAQRRALAEEVAVARLELQLRGLEVDERASDTE